MSRAPYGQCFKEVGILGLSVDTSLTRLHQKIYENPSERISTHYDLLVSTTGTLTLWHSATIFYSKHSMSSNFCVGYALLAHKALGLNKHRKLIAVAENNVSSCRLTLSKIIMFCS